MFSRILFWLGLSLGGAAAFLSRRQWLTSPSPRSADPFAEAGIEPDPLFSLTGDAVVTCDAAGVVVSANDAARDWFGLTLSALPLRYPTGQPVPPGQTPLTRVLRTGRPVAGAGYLADGPDGAARVLEVSARPLPGGGAAAVFRDITALQTGQTRETDRQRREAVIRRFCRRLSAASHPEDLSRAIAESALALPGDLPGAQARLFAWDEETRLLTRLASAPDEGPKRPRSQKEAQAQTVPFHAGDPLHWQVYVTRQMFAGDAGSGEACLALPLEAGGSILGHLSLTARRADALAEPGLRESLILLASVAALALSGPRHSAQAASLAQQVTALRGVVAAVSAGQDAAGMADLVCGHARQALGAEVCTLMLRADDRLTPVGEDYKDALLSPERFGPDHPLPPEAAASRAVEEGKSVSQTGLANPGLEEGHWRAFAGQSGRHSVLAVPLPGGQGALTAIRSGEDPFTGEQTRFLETLAALTAAGRPGATPS